MEQQNTNIVTIDNNLVIRDCIFTIRGLQVMVDWDLAILYGVETRVMNQAVKRNEERFPKRFRFKLLPSEMDELITNCDKSGRFKHYPGLPYVFTEQGIAMLASVLRSATAISVSVKIMDAFVEMRRMLSVWGPLNQRLDEIQKKQILDQAKNEERFDQIFNELGKQEMPLQGVFYDGQLWDACSLVEKLITKAKATILLIDNWVDTGTLDILAKKPSGVSVEIVTSKRGNTIAASDIAKFNAQYPTLSLRLNEHFHDRFLIIDDKELYLIGASLKDLGKKCFGFTKMDNGEIMGIKARI
ncbi:MAG: ORF6N domain-containing protein [Victivallales bacterium]|nr:ORF6N domain-containing protein [Victivallales bacterium]